MFIHVTSAIAYHLQIRRGWGWSANPITPSGSTIVMVDQARIQKIFKGGVGEEEIFQRKMYVDTRINACTHKN